MQQLDFKHRNGEKLSLFCSKLLFTRCYAVHSKEDHESAIFGHCAWPSSVVNNYLYVNDPFGISKMTHDPHYVFK